MMEILEVKSLVRSLADSIGQRGGGLNYTIFVEIKRSGPVKRYGLSK